MFGIMGESQYRFNLANQSGSKHFFTEINHWNSRKVRRAWPDASPSLQSSDCNVGLRPEYRLTKGTGVSWIHTAMQGTEDMFLPFE